jgi:hypothetical protein
MDFCFKNPGLGNLPLQRIELCTSRIRTVCHILQFDLPFSEGTSLVKLCSLDSGFLILPARITARFTLSTISVPERPPVVRLRFVSRQGIISVFATVSILIVEPS